MMALVSGACLEQAKRALYDCALEDAPSHVQCDNGGAYAVWKLADGSVLLAGFDNGGSDIAQSGAATQAAAALGAASMRAGASHYDPSVVLHPDNPPTAEYEVNIAALTRQLRAARLARPARQGP